MSDSSSGKVAVIAKIPAKPGRRDDLVTALSTALDTAKGERGTIYYILHTDDKDADLLWMYELYESQAALGEHMGSEAFKALGPAIGGLVGGVPELIFTKPVGGKGL